MCSLGGLFAADVQRFLDFLKRGLGLGQEVDDDSLAEVALVLIVVHLEDLLEGGVVDDIRGQVSDIHGCFLCRCSVLKCVVGAGWPC